jgi:Tol biopolymer transport system component
VAAGEGAVSQLTDDSGSSYAPVWSPDGSLIVFVSDRGGDGDVYLMDASGERPLLLTRSDDGAEDRIRVYAGHALGGLCIHREMTCSDLSGQLTRDG